MCIRDRFLMFAFYVRILADGLAEWNLRFGKLYIDFITLFPVSYTHLIAPSRKTSFLGILILRSRYL